MSEVDRAMNTAGLDFDHIPPLSVPFRFFISASLFGALAGIALVLMPGAASGNGLGNRWSPELLSITHLITLGVIMMVMLGALFQILPVVGAEPVKQPHLRAALIHPLLCLGTLALSVGLWVLGTPLGKTALWIAMLLLPCALLVAMASYLPAIVCHIRSNATLRQASWALLALGITLLLGCWQLLGWSLPQQFPLDRRLTDLHALWGTLGWCLLLIGAVAYQVVPMFHTAPAVPTRVQQFSAPVLILLLIGLGFFQGWSPVPWFELLLSVYSLLLASGLLGNLARRRRRVADATLRAWQLAATCLMLACFGFWLSVWGWVPESFAFILLLYGVILSVVIGMLLKICAFLLYLHLQQRCGTCFEAFALLPKMHELIAQQQGQRLLALHLFALLTLLTATIAPLPTLICGAALCSEFAYLLTLQCRALGRYRVAAQRIDVQVSQQNPGLANGARAAKE
ncbi:hypothetical protein MIB92_09200 [Aestuariirhabdus sp. Z084]|uniref:hypothetical protein n=1 Tax=Aestuariirhabdus haliotis TaxID=2918751 RepID=UPI00201B3F27|nr:hypothetical protein [Aestuariirhabdus haliotis]MCL6415828.1 hypothetical protein [Aestuariirhabdus haliotis]MCL6419870.1 hypothetical protein [Aestuariirhabdus haliotis]